MSKKKKLDEKIENAFMGKDHDYVDSYLTTLHENLRFVSSSMGRLTTMLVLLIAVFELVARAAITKANLGPFEVSDLSFIRIGLPVVIAYLTYELIHLANVRGDIEQVQAGVIRITRKDLYENDLDSFIVPEVHGLWRGFVKELYSDRMVKVFDVWRIAALIIFLTGLIAFQIYAYTLQFRQAGFADPTVWAALLVSLFFMLYAVMVFFSRD